MRGKLVFLTALVVAFCLGGFCMYYMSKDNTETTYIKTETTRSNGVVKCKNDVEIDETGISEAVSKIYDATVTVQTYRNDRLYASGSGFVYKKDEKYAYVMTNHHVIENGDKIILVLSNDDEIEGKVLGSDEYLDLAVIRIGAKDALAVATIGTSEETNVGDTIITVGSPMGYNYRGTVTRGTLSAKNRTVEVSVKTTDDFVMNVLQIDAAISPGNSGGPLVNTKGEVIGINSLKLVQEDVENIGFAIPIEYAMEYAATLEKGQKIEKPLIGISMLNVTDTYRLYQNGITVDKNIKSGVVVTSVTKGSGAANAGIERGDVITEINGNKVTNTAYLKYELYKAKVGDTIQITYIRDGKSKTVKVTLTKVED